MRPLVIAMVLLIAPMHTSAAPVPDNRTSVFSPKISGDCPPISQFHARQEGGKLGLQKLGDLPPADTYAAAYRRIEGCEVPIVLRYGVELSPTPRR